MHKRLAQAQTEILRAFVLGKFLQLNFITKVGLSICLSVRVPEEPSEPCQIKKSSS